MFGVGVGVRVGGRTPVGGSAYDADAQAFFNRVTTAGGTLSTTEKNATNQLVLDMKSAGIWTPMKAIYPMVGASAAACAQNLKSSSFTGSFTSGWTFASTGVTPNGASTGFNTNYLVDSSNGFSMANNHIAHYSRTQATGVYVDMGCGTNVPSNNFNNVYQELGGNVGGSLGSLSFNVAVANTIGFVLKGATSSTNAKMYKNGSLIQTITTAQANGNNININMYVGCQFRLGAPSEVSVRQCAFASIGKGLNDTQAANYYTAVQAFQTTLSRQV
jgi:hypothetical protein